MSMPFQQAQTYLTYQQTKSKRVTHYTLKLAQCDYTHQGPLIRDALKRIKGYYSKYDLECESEVQALTSDNLLNVKVQINYNKRMHSGTCLSEVQNIKDRMMLFVELCEHIRSLKEECIDSGMINLNPSSIVKSGNLQIILTDFFLPMNQSSGDSELALWYLSQQSPEQLTLGLCNRQSIVWQLGCLLYFLLTNRCPFIPAFNDAIRTNGQISVTRRNILLIKYQPYPDEKVQSSIFSKLFVAIEDSPRLTLEQLIELVRHLLIDAPSLMPVVDKKSPNDSEEEVIEDEYYDEEEEGHAQSSHRELLSSQAASQVRQSDNKLQFSVEYNKQSEYEYGTSNKKEHDHAFSSVKKNDLLSSEKKQVYTSEKKSKKSDAYMDESHVNSSPDSSARQSQVPIFDNLPSVRSKNTNEYKSQNEHAEQMKNAFYNQNLPDFDNLPSMRSSMGGSYDNFQNSEQSFEQQSYKIKIPNKNQEQLELDLSSLQSKSKHDKSQVKKGVQLLNSSQSSHRSKLSSHRLKKPSEELKSSIASNKELFTKQNKAQFKNQEDNDLQISFLESERNSEKSARSSKLGGANSFLDDQSSIHQQLNDTEMNLDDQIGFVVVINECTALGISIDSAQFVLYTFDPARKTAENQMLQCQNDCQVAGLKQVISVPSMVQNQIFIIITTETNLNVFQFSYANMKSPILLLLKQQKIAADCVCASYAEPCFYIAVTNKIGKAFIDPTTDKKINLTKKKLQFYNNDQVKVTAMTYTILKDSDDETDAEGFMAIATSDFSFIILRISKQGHQEVLAQLEDIHTNDITQVLALTDNSSTLSFVTLSLDCQIKIFSFEGELEYETLAQGQAITGVVVPNKKDYFVVSTFNEETNQNMVTVFRKQKSVFSFGPYDDCVLDLKMAHNKLFMPKGTSNVERMEIKGL